MTNEQLMAWAHADKPTDGMIYVGAGITLQELRAAIRRNEQNHFARTVSKLAVAQSVVCGAIRTVANLRRRLDANTVENISAEDRSAVEAFLAENRLTPILRSAIHKLIANKPVFEIFHQAVLLSDILDLLVSIDRKGLTEELRLRLTVMISQTVEALLDPSR